ncbi:MAG: hypothetical protein L6277_09185 [Desulfobacterales bacterium]|nr:hypothetical protein [Pseudomonadota bacterium]MBU4356581.1 hypothetical protein [Pseudomonadota bacterium]MCG2772246.1 hypothetical protein [Desulfobacterales bacterium]
MLEKFDKIGNPLTIIGIFAGIIEVAGTCILPWLVGANQDKFVWFLIGFPILLVVLFFITLNCNPKVLYAPMDYREDSSFLNAHNIQNSTISEPQEGIIVGEIKNDSEVIND